MKPIIYLTLLLSLAFSGVCHAEQEFICSNNNKIKCTDNALAKKKVEYTWNGTVLCGCVKDGEVIHSFQDDNGKWHKITIPENTTCKNGWEAYSLAGTQVYHMFGETICHEDTQLSNMKPEDYKETCYGEWVDNDGDTASAPQYSRCPEMQWEANIALLTDWDAEQKKEVLSKDTNKACVVKNEKEFTDAIKLAAGTTYNGLPIWKGMIYEYLDDKQVEGCGEYNPEDCTLILNYFVKPAYWAFEHTCTVGVDEYDNKSKPIAKYKFNENGEIEKQVYNKDKKEWGASQSKKNKPGSSEWVKGAWIQDTTGWCAKSKTYCVINKRIEVENGVKLSKPIVTDKQEQKTWPFRIEIKYEGADNPKFPGISYDPEDVYDGMSIDGAPHQFVISGFDLAGQNFYGEMLPIYPDISGVTLTTTENLFDNPAVSPIFVANPFFGSGPVMGGMYEIPQNKCKSEYGLDACYGVNFQYYEEGLTARYIPDWVGIYLDNKFQSAACADNLNETIFECDHDVILQTDPEFEDGIDKWSSKVIIPAGKIKNNAEYQFVFNWFARPDSIKYKNGSTQYGVISLVKRDVKSPVACAEGEAKFKGSCIKATECAAKNGFLKKYLGHDVCLQCGQNEILVGNSCANKYKLNTCETENRVWEIDSCGGCKSGFKDIGGVCINTASEKAVCEVKPATHGKWTYSSTSNTCSFSCDKGFIGVSSGVCELKCDGNGLVPNSGETACECDTANHWVQNGSGSGCKCADGYEAPNGVCELAGPVEPDKCTADSECDDDELCKDGKCQKEEPQPFKGECKSSADCGTGMVCSSKNECVCDTDNYWHANDDKNGCVYNEQWAVESMCILNDGKYLDGRCIYNPDEIACLKSDGKWEEDICWHDPDGDGEWTPDTGLPPSNSGSGCGTISGASLPESLGSILPYLLVLGIVLSFPRKRLPAGSVAGESR